MRREKLEKGIYFGMLGNMLFLAFGILAYIYYLTFSSGSVFSRIMEAVAYLTEFTGFGLLIYSDYLLIKSVRLRQIMKISYTAYIVLEAVMMILEITAADLNMYKPYSLPLAVVHAVISGLACFAFLQLDPENPRFETLVVVCISIMFAGMVGNLLGIRVYFSIILNAIGFTVLFAGIRYFTARQEIEIDCYGDAAEVMEFNSSSLFADPEIQKLGYEEPDSEEEAEIAAAAEDEAPKADEADEAAEEKAPEASEKTEDAPNGSDGKKKQRRKKSNFI